MNRQSLFDRTVIKLQGIIEKGDEFDMLEAAGAIRKLLLDESPLVHQVNRQRRRRITFEVERPTALQRLTLDSNPTMYFLMEGVSPRLTLTATAGTDALKLDQFLARSVAWIGGRPCQSRTSSCMSRTLRAGYMPALRLDPLRPYSMMRTRL